MSISLLSTIDDQTHAETILNFLQKSQIPKLIYLKISLVRAGGLRQGVGEPATCGGSPARVAWRANSIHPYFF